MRYLLLLLLLINSLSLLSQIQWQDYGIPVRQGDYVNWEKIAVAVDDEIIFFWTDYRSGNISIWAQKTDANGDLLWENDVLICGVAGEQREIRAVAGSDGTVIVCWEDERNNFDLDIYAQKIDVEGNLLWQENGIPVCVYDDYQYWIEILADNSGGFFAFWKDHRDQSQGNIFGSHFSSSGSIEDGWQVNGDQIFENGFPAWPLKVITDGSNGVILICTMTNYPEDGILAGQRISESGELLWGDSGITIQESADIQSHLSIAKITASEFILTWSDSAWEDPGDIYARKFNISGELLWENEIAVCPNDRYQDSPQIVASGDGTAIIAWQENTNYNDEDIYAQKIDSDGNVLWSETGIPVSIAESTQFYFDMISDDSGGFRIIWRDYRDGNSIYYQHVNTDGEFELTENGELICDIAPEYRPAIKTNGSNEHFIIWLDKRTNSDEIFLQVLDENNEILLQENGVRLIAGISGRAGNYMLHENSNEPVIIWEDTRYDQDIYMQILLDNGEPYFEDNGLNISFPDSNQIRHSHSAFSADNGIIAYIYETGQGDKVLVQAVDLNGNMLWGENGLEIAISSYGYYDKIISYNINEQNFYIGYPDYVDFFNPIVYVQKIDLNGNMLWDNVVLVQSDAGEEFQLIDVVEDFFVWIRNEWPYSDLLVKKLDENGNTAPGWLDDGLVISENLYWNSNIKHQKTSEGLFLTWIEPDDDFNIYGQIITDNGVILWEEGGLQLCSALYDQDDQELCYYNDQIYLVWTDFRNGSDYDIYMQKYDLSGAPLWENDLLINISPTTDETEPLIIDINNNLLVIWKEYDNNNETYSAIKAQLVSASGELIWDPEGETIKETFSYSNIHEIQVVSGENDCVYVSWYDTYSNGAESFKNIFAQKFIVDDTGITAYEIPDQSNAGVKNYPNPFNPYTVISFETTDSRIITELDIYNLKGQKIKNLLEEVISSGEHKIIWDGSDMNDRSVPSGIYFYKLRSGDKEETGKMILLK